MTLPEKYEVQMKNLLQEEYKEYAASLLEEGYAGLRVNTLKITPEDFKKRSPFSLISVPWTENGFYYEKEKQPARHPYYHAGLYYIQEPSAMLPAAALPISKGDKVLDLCAAPGGKSTELAAKLQGTGILVSNDISNSRAKGLLKNIELFGIRNAVVTSEDPKKLTSYFPEYFDKILVDAPCSGEGMFRRDKGMIKSWQEKGPEYYSRIQKEIISEAAKMLKSGGLLLYSTCTFSPLENEGTLQFLLKTYPEFQVEQMKKINGFRDGKPEWISSIHTEISRAIRLWPHHINGEGHFTALLRKGNKAENRVVELKEVPFEVNYPDKGAEEFLKPYVNALSGQVKQIGDQYYLLPKPMQEISLKGLRILRTGLYLGEKKKHFFEPSQALAMALKKEEYLNCLDYSSEDTDVIRYLKCETLALKQECSEGIQLVCADGFPLGFGKKHQMMLKNKYYPGWKW